MSFSGRKAAPVFARDIQTLASGGAEQVGRGFHLYREMCVMCDIPVGRTLSPMGKGLNPQAPDFAEIDMIVAELFWIVKHLIRFAGMPAWDPSLSDQEFWDMIGFNQVLAKMSAVDYDALDHRISSGPEPQK